MFGERGIVELVFLAAVALIVVGPKDLPILMRRIGQFTAKMRGLANEFRSSFEEMARQSELDELRREVEALRSGQLSVVDHQRELEAEFDELHHTLHPVPAAEPAWNAPAAAEPWPYVPAPPESGAEDETMDLFADTLAAADPVLPFPEPHAPAEARG